MLKNLKGALQDIRSHLDEHHVVDLHTAATMADDYALTHKSSFHKVESRFNGGFKKKAQNSGNLSQQTDADKYAAHDKDSGLSSGNDVQSSQTKAHPPKGLYCKKHGHLKDECWFLERKKMLHQNLWA